MMSTRTGTPAKAGGDRTTWLVLLGAAAVVGLAIAQQGARRSNHPSLGMALPDLSLPLIGGGTTRLGDLKGKVVLLNFWATWCGTCRTELPEVQKTFESIRRGDFALYGVNLEPGAERSVASFLRRGGYSFPCAIDRGGRVARALQVEQIPLTVLVDRTGIVRRSFSGEASASELARAAEELLTAVPRGSGS